MQNDQRVLKIASLALNVTKMLVIIYLGIEELFKISKSLKQRLDPDFDISRWASQAYAILKKRQAEQKEAVGIEN